MEINPNRFHHMSSSDMAAKAQVQAPEKIHRIEPQKVAEIGEEKDPQIDPKRFDTYEKSEGNSALEVEGIDKRGEDENRTPKILFNKPEQTNKGAEEPSKSEGSSKSEDDKTKDIKCTVNTDKVDDEIKKLKQKKQEIQRQLQTEKDADKHAKLEQQLQSLESELQMKDNDTYRKQNAIYTFG